MRGQVRLGVDAPEEAAILGAGGAALVLVAFILPVLFRVVFLNGALVHVVVAFALDGCVALGGHVVEGAGGDFVLEGRRLAHGWRFAKVLGEGAALLE